MQAAEYRTRHAGWRASVLASRARRAMPPALVMLLMLVLPLDTAFGHAMGQGGTDFYIMLTPKSNVLEAMVDAHYGELRTAAMSVKIDKNHNGELDPDELKDFTATAEKFYRERLSCELRLHGENFFRKVPFRLPEGGLEKNTLAYSPKGDRGKRTLRVRFTFEAPWPERLIADTGQVFPVRVQTSFCFVKKYSCLFTLADTEAPVKIVQSDTPSAEEKPLPPDITKQLSSISLVPRFHSSVFALDLSGKYDGPPPFEMKSSHRYHDPASVTNSRLPWWAEERMKKNDAPPTNDAAVKEYRIAFVDASTNDAWLTETGDSTYIRPPRPPIDNAVTRFQARMKERVFALFKPPLSVWSWTLAMLLCFVWGGAHAFTPGHGKAIASAYLVGTHGSYRHAVLLGIIVTVTHTIIVFTLAIVAVILKDKFVYPPWLAPLGAVMLILVAFNQVRIGFGSILDYFFPDDDSHRHGHHHGHSHEHAELPAGNVLTTRSLVTVGATGGIVPCHAAVIMLLLLWQLQEPVLALLCVVTFSVGLATTLSSVGALAVVGTRAVMKWLKKEGKTPTKRHFPYESLLPIAGGIVLALLGALLLSTLLMPR